MIYIGTPDGKELRPLGEVSEVELSSEEPGEDFGVLRGKADSFECEFKLEDREDGLNPYRILASGFDRSTYNSMTLREEGKLTPENGWLEGKI